MLKVYSDSKNLGGNSCGEAYLWGLTHADNSRILPGAFSNQVSGGNYVNVTMGANYRHTDRWTFRPEVRWDWSDTKSNDLSVPGAFGDFSENDQFTLSLDAIFTY